MRVAMPACVAAPSRLGFSQPCVTPQRTLQRRAVGRTQAGAPASRQAQAGTCVKAYVVGPGQEGAPEPDDVKAQQEPLAEAGLQKAVLKALEDLPAAVADAVAKGQAQQQPLTEAVLQRELSNFKNSLLLEVATKDELKEVKEEVKEQLKEVKEEAKENSNRLIAFISLGFAVLGYLMTK